MAESNSLFGGSKDKVIETENLLIRGHLLRWADTAIQISNISLVTTANLPFPQFPVLAAIMTIAGIVLSPDRHSSVVGSLLALAGIAWLVWWGVRCYNVHGKKYLHISLNSGLTYSLYLSNQIFMRQVLQLFANIFESGTTNETNFQISVNGCEIRENGSVVSLNVRE